MPLLQAGVKQEQRVNAQRAIEEGLRRAAQRAREKVAAATDDAEAPQAPQAPEPREPSGTAASELAGAPPAPDDDTVARGASEPVRPLM